MEWHSPLFLQGAMTRVTRHPKAEIAPAIDLRLYYLYYISGNIVSRIVSSSSISWWRTRVERMLWQIPDRVALWRVSWHQEKNATMSFHLRFTVIDLDQVQFLVMRSFRRVSSMFTLQTMTIMWALPDETDERFNFTGCCRSCRHWREIWCF